MFSAQNIFYAIVANSGLIHLAAQWFLEMLSFVVEYIEVHEGPCQVIRKEKVLISVFCLERWSIGYN